LCRIYLFKFEVLAAKMPQVFLETPLLHRYDPRALEVLYSDIVHFRRRRLVQQEVSGIYSGGVTIIFTGSGLNFAPELNYALFYENVRLRTPLRLTLTCHASRGESHAEVIQSGPAGRLIVAGTVRKRKFAGVSTTWMKYVHPQSGRHTFGLFMNQLLLDCYHIEREPSWTEQTAESSYYS
jgi:hypothetical protein